MKNGSRFEESYCDQARLCLTKVRDAIFKFKWTTPNLNEYLLECIEQIDNVQSHLDRFKTYNVKIVDLIEQSCNNPLVKYQTFKTSDVESLHKEIKKYMKQSIENIFDIYKNILKYISSVFKCFEEYIEDIPLNWLKYITQFDELLETAVKFNIRTSMENMLKNLTGDGTVGPLPVLNMNILVQNGKMSLNPNFQEIFDVFYSFFHGIIDYFRVIPRIYEKFGFPNIGLKTFDVVISEDEECKKYQELIIFEIHKTFKKVEDRVKAWQTFEHLWKIPREEFLEEYVSQKPTFREIKKDVTRYTELANDIQMKENIIQVDFLMLDFSNVKLTLFEECKKWQDKFQEITKSSQHKDINAIYTYIKQSDAVDFRPNALVELQESMDIYDKLCMEILDKKKETCISSEK